MKITTELSIRDFNAWSGAVTTQKEIIRAGKAEEFDDLINELYPEGIDATQLNDLLWFEVDWLYETLGLIEEETEE